MFLSQTNQSYSTHLFIEIDCILFNNILKILTILLFSFIEIYKKLVRHQIILFR